MLTALNLLTDVVQVKIEINIILIIAFQFTIMHIPCDLLFILNEIRNILVPLDYMIHNNQHSDMTENF